MSVRVWMRGARNSAIMHDVQSAARVLADILLAGGVVALPTDTVYGVAALAQNTAACQQLYRLKGRCVDKPLAVCVADVCDVCQWADVDAVPAALLYALLPGPVTVVLPRRTALNPALNAATRLVGVRVPDSQLVRELARATSDGRSQPLALTSANVSGDASALCVDDFSALHDQLDAVADVGQLDSRVEGSTVVDLSRPPCYRVVRDGCARARTLDILHTHGWSQDC